MADPPIGSDAHACLSDLLVSCDVRSGPIHCLKTLTEICDPFVEDILKPLPQIFSVLLESETFRQTDALTVRLLRPRQSHLRGA